ncbi:HupU protein [Azoarcus indigens]|uniref:hydrogenase (acceptor) n=1 Tax=Azoarcus indigens TaxID=29545 RepID=A0A4R6DHQ1_9RHOO|nr:HupU protein [Azoarcus indigens]NMG67478.1 HupU protein [Azoarcus indigens]TDN44110.1 ferredoxin hydrogenase small subunit [Azoarcus indigens]
MNLLWLQSGGCGGCTMSLLCADTRDLFGLLGDAGIKVLWHPALSEESGAEALSTLEACCRGEIPVDLLCVEGSLLRGPNGSGRFHVLAGTGKPMIHWVSELAAQARYTLAIGSCAAFGGVTAGGPNPTDACGLQYENEARGGLLGAGYRSGADLPVINVAGCPTHPGWVVDTLLALAMGEFGAADLDSLGRPRFYADQLVHHGCSRNEFYEFKASAEKASDLGCMMEHMGCKGTQAHADCNVRPWNGAGSCTAGGYACISCTEPGFEEPGHPFSQTPKVAGIPIGLPSDMPKAWFVALAALSKSATPRRVRENAVADHPVVQPAIRRTGLR